MSLEIEESFVLSGKTKVKFGHQPDNVLTAFFLDGAFLKNAEDSPPLGNYSSLSFSVTPPIATTNKVTNYGVKTYSGIGSLGFWTDESGKKSSVWFKE